LLALAFTEEIAGTMNTCIQIRFAGLRVFHVVAKRMVGRHNEKKRERDLEGIRKGWKKQERKKGNEVERHEVQTWIMGRLERKLGSLTMFCIHA
jgi:hypothetical protein